MLLLGLTCSSAISREEKDHIRARLLDSGMSEANNRLALQNAVVCARIVRAEFPHDWYESS